MLLELVVGFSVVEDLFERCIFECGIVNVMGDLVVVEYRSVLCSYVVIFLFL